MTPQRQGIENRQKFFARLKGKVSDNDFKRIHDAYSLAKTGHRNQFRDDDTRYFEHCRETALILMDELGIYDADLIIAALLHDMIEDSKLITLESIAETFGNKVADLIKVMSKPKKGDARFKNDDRKRHQYYFTRLYNSDWLVWLLKLCDRLHNTRTLGKCLPEKRARKIQETYDVYLPLIPMLAAVNAQTNEWAKIIAAGLSLALHELEM